MRQPGMCRDLHRAGHDGRNQPIDGAHADIVVVPIAAKVLIELVIGNGRPGHAA